MFTVIVMDKTPICPAVSSIERKKDRSPPCAATWRTSSPRAQRGWTDLPAVRRHGCLKAVKNQVYERENMEFSAAMQEVLPGFRLDTARLFVPVKNYDEQFRTSLSDPGNSPAGLRGYSHDIASYPTAKLSCPHSLARRRDRSRHYLPWLPTLARWPHTRPRW